jgi:hypothetical protein
MSVQSNSMFPEAFPLLQEQGGTTLLARAPFFIAGSAFQQAM